MTVQILSQKPLTGKQVVFFGDSIVEDARSSPNSMTAFFADVSGATVTNAGIGGTKISEFVPSDNWSKVSLSKMLTAIATNSWAQYIADATVVGDGAQANLLAAFPWSTGTPNLAIWEGTNEYGASVPIGSPSDTDPTLTTYGALNSGLALMAANRPNVRIIFLSPMWRARFGTADLNSNSDVWANSQGRFLREYGNALANRAAAYGHGFLDAYNALGATVATEAAFIASQPTGNRSGQRLSDGLHPSEFGQRWLGPWMGRNLTPLCR